MDSKKQKLLIEYLISSPDTFALCQAIVEPEYFDPEFQNTVKFVKDYYEKYNATPDPIQIEAETGQVINKREVGNDQLQYCSNEIETFCKHRAMEKAILSSVPDVEKGDFGAIENKIKQAVMVSLHRDLGLRYFQNPQERLERMLKGNQTITTKWTEIDDLLFGGISRRELLLVSAGPGGGKSICLANLGFNFLEQGLDVLYVSLELAQDVIAQRFDTMFTGIGRKVWKQHASEIAVRVTSSAEGKGNLDIKQLPTGTNCIQIRAYLKEYCLFYGKMPDLLILDYLDLMNPNEKIDLGDVFAKDKLCSEQLRDIGVTENLCVATASQLNRSAVNATQHDHSQIAGGISKINTADTYWSIMFTETQKAKGEMAFILQKTRNSDGVGKTVYMKWDPKHLRILDLNKSGPSDLKLIKKDKLQTMKDSILGEMPSGDALTGLMSSTK